MSPQLLFLLPFILLSYLGAQPIALQPANAIIASGAANSAVASANGIVLLNADFSTAGSARAVWDIPMHHDMSQCAGVRVRFRAINAAIASEMTLHLNIGGRWFSTQFSPKSAQCWEEMMIPKAAFLPENDAPGGSWRNVSKLRIGVWRGAPGRFQLQLASIECVRANSPLMIIRPAIASGATASDKRSALRYCQLLDTALCDGGIYPAVVEEPDVTSTLLARYRAILLPSANHVGNSAADLINERLRNGGKLVAFHSLTPRVSNALQVPAGKFATLSRLGMPPFSGVRTAGGAFFRQHSTAFIDVSSNISAQLKCRGWWCDNTGKNTKYPAIVQSPYGLWFTHVYMHQDCERGTAVLAAFLEDFAPGLRRIGAAQLRRSAKFALDNADKHTTHDDARNAFRRFEQRLAANDYSGVLTAYRQLFGALSDESLPTPASVMSFDGAKNEMRGVWTRAKTGLPGENWFKTLRRLQESGFNAVFPNFFTPYYAMYPTKYASPDPALRSLGDPVGACLAAGANTSIAVHAWCYILNVSEAPESFKKQMAAEGRLQCRMNGATVPWLCPSDSRNRELLKTLLKEFLQAYPRLNGIHFDMLRFESSNVCYCERCRNAFNQYLGHAAGGWPECTLDASKERKAWRTFRCGQINRLIQELSTAARAVNPRIVISAAVYPDSESARNGVGQDWAKWLELGSVSFVAPMNYRSSAYLFQGDITRQRASVSSPAQLRPGIGVTTNNLDRTETLRQVQTVRNAGLGGFILFEYTTKSADELAVRK